MSEFPTERMASQTRPTLEELTSKIVAARERMRAADSDYRQRLAVYAQSLKDYAGKHVNFSGLPERYSLDTKKLLGALALRLKTADLFNRRPEAGTPTRAFTVQDDEREPRDFNGATLQTIYEDEISGEWRMKAECQGISYDFPLGSVWNLQPAEAESNES